jgi:hypothetical protein
MRKILSALILIMAFSLHAQAGVNLLHMNGELWKKVSKLTRGAYLQGVFDGLAFPEFKIHDVRVSTDLSIDQYVDAIDEI